MDTSSAESTMLASGLICGIGFSFLLNIIRKYYPKTIRGVSEWLCATVALSGSLVVYSGAFPFFAHIKLFLGRLLFLIGMSLILLGLRRFARQDSGSRLVFCLLILYTLFVLVVKTLGASDELALFMTMLLAIDFARQSVGIVRKLPSNSVAEKFLGSTLILFIVIFVARLLFSIFNLAHGIEVLHAAWALELYTLSFIACFVCLVCSMLVVTAKSLRHTLISANAYDEGDFGENGERSRLREDLRMSIERHQLEVHYQPRVDIDTGKVVGAEALVRWKHPHLRYVPPEKFIPIAEESDFIQVLGGWVIEESMACAARMKNRNHNVKVSINISAKQLATKNFFELVRAAMESAGITPDMIELELTETVAIKNAESAISTMRKLQGIGLDVSIDDFGTGYSALSYLAKMPVTCLKLDKSFVQGIEVDAAARTLIQGVIDLGRSLGFRIVAEGVETHGQYEFLKEKGADEYQGYLHSKPVKEDLLYSILAKPPISNLTYT